MRKNRTCRSYLPQGLDIIYEDRDILVADKPSGLLTIGTEREKLRTAYCALTDYVRKGCTKSGARIFIVHRLDRETSGILVFAKNESAKFRLQSRWEETKKKYIAAVHGRCEKRSGIITSRLAENAAYHVYSTSDPEKGKPASTAYKVIRENRRFSLLEIDLLTGRKHQIRVHLADIGHPVLGDKRYGKADKEQRLGLHALSLSFRHPVSDRLLCFETEVPSYFNMRCGVRGEG